jgi:hypothetical protein
MPTDRTKQSGRAQASNTFGFSAFENGKTTRAANDNLHPYRFVPKLDQWWWTWLLLSFSLPMSLTGALARMLLAIGDWLAGDCCFRALDSEHGEFSYEMLVVETRNEKARR